MGNSAKVPPSGANTSATREPAGDGADGLEMERLALEREKLLLERQKTAIDARLRRRELSARRDKGWLETLASPLPLAIVGGFITLMTTIVTNFLTQTANLEAEQSRARLARESAQQELQAELIKKFVESPKTETVRENLRFLVDAGLLPDYAQKITAYLNANPGIAPQVGTPPSFVPALILPAGFTAIEPPSKFGGPGMFYTVEKLSGGSLRLYPTCKMDLQETSETWLRTKVENLPTPVRIPATLPQSLEILLGESSKNIKGITVSFENKVIVTATEEF